MSYDRRHGAADEHEAQAERFRVRVERELNKIVQGAGKVIHVQSEGPGSGWLVVFDTEYAALKAYYHYRRSEPNFGKASTGGWYVSINR
jgi:hypothetical protein